MTRAKELSIRVTEADDAAHLTRWLSDPAILRWFPMINEREIEDAVKIWVSFAKQEACLTALWNGHPCGSATLNIQPYKKLAHQCLLSIIVEDPYRGKGIGTALIEELLVIADEKFHMEFIHLEVYDGNPAIRLYRRLGFQEYGRHPKFLKDQGEYIDKILMERVL